MSTDDSADDEPLFDPRITGYSWGRGILGGVWTFVMGYLAMGALILVPDGPSEGSSAGEILGEIGRIFYSAHNVTLELRSIGKNVRFRTANQGVNISAVWDNETILIDNLGGQPIPLGASNETNLTLPENVFIYDFARIQDPVAYAQAKPEVAYYLVPVLVLIAAGAVVAYFTLPEDTSLEEAVLPGLGLGAGYTATAVLGTFFVGREMANDAILLTPNLGQSIVLALAYSLFCGLVGSVALGAWRNSAQLRRTFGR